MKNIFRILVLAVIIFVLFWLLPIIDLILFSFFGFPVADRQINNSYFYNVLHTDVVYSPDKNWFEAAYQPLHTNVFDFTAINENFGKDKEKVYYNGDVINGADPATFVVVHGDESKDKNNVYLDDKVVEGVDASSFRYLGDDYFADENSVYVSAIYKLAIIPGAQPATFEALKGSIYSKDSQSVFCEKTYDEAVLVEGADPKSFSALYTVGSDKNFTYENCERSAKK
jgi:hypothetical protein